MVYRNSECTPVFSSILQNNYEINLVFYPVLNYSSSRRESGIVIDTFLKTFSKNNGFYDSICFYSIYYYPDEKLWSTDNFYFVAIIKISINYWHNYKVFIQRLNGALASLQGQVISGFSVRNVGQTFLTLYEHGKVLVEGIQNPMNNDILIHQSDFIGKYTAQTRACYEFAAIKRVSLVAEWSICPRFQFDTRDVHITISNFSVCFVKLDFCVDSVYYRLSNNKNKVEVCVKQYTEAKLLKSLSPNPTSEGFHVIFICYTLSSAGCITSLISSLIIHRKSYIKFNIIIASFFIILANTSYILCEIFHHGTFGQVLQGLNHLCWLTVASFLFISCLTSCCSRVLRCNKVPIPNVGQNTFLSLLISLVLVFVGLLLEHMKYPPLSRTLFTFTLPILLLAVLSLLLFFFIIQKTENISSIGVYEWQLVTTFCKMSILAAYSWLFHYMHRVYLSQVFFSLHLFLIATMGLFLFFAFVSPSKNNQCACEKTQLSTRKD